jgi:hypothetical protein
MSSTISARETYINDLDKVLHLQDEVSPKPFQRNALERPTSCAKTSKTEQRYIVTWYAFAHRDDANATWSAERNVEHLGKFEVRSTVDTTHLSHHMVTHLSSNAE